MDEEAHTVNDRLNREEAITAACGDNAAFRQRLLEYADKFPQARRSGSFRAVAGDEAPLWDWIGQWNEAVQTIGRRNSARFNRKTAADAGSQTAEAAGRSSRPSRCGCLQAAIAVPGCHRSADRRRGQSDRGGAQARFHRSPRGRRMDADGYDGTEVLLAGRSRGEVRTAGALQPDARTASNMLSASIFPRSENRSAATRSTPTGSVAPQRATAKALAAILDGTTDEPWESSFCRMIETVLNDQDTDPLLKHFLLRKIVAVGCQGSLCLQKGFGGYAERPEELEGSGLGQLG